MGKGPRRRARSQRRYHQRTLKNAHKASKDPMPAASDVQVFDAEGNLVRIERSKKPLDP